MTRDGDVEPNPGPPLPIEGGGPDLGAAFLQSVRTAPILALALPGAQLGGSRMVMDTEQQPPGRGQKRPLQVSDGPFCCCFPTCPRSERRGGTPWRSKADMIQHVSAVHVANKELPSKSWLASFDRWICGHCYTLKANGNPCRGENCYSLSVGEVPSRWIGNSGKPYESVAVSAPQQRSSPQQGVVGVASHLHPT